MVSPSNIPDEVTMCNAAPVHLHPSRTANRIRSSSASRIPPLVLAPPSPPPPPPPSSLSSSRLRTSSRRDCHCRFRPPRPPSPGQFGDKNAIQNEALIEGKVHRRATKVTNIRRNKTRRAYLICIRKTQIESPCVMMVEWHCLHRCG